MEGKKGERKISKRVLFLGKAVFTLLLVALILYRADWGKIFGALKNANVPLIAVVFFSMAGNVAISAYKWQFLLHIYDIGIKLPRLTKYYFTAMFFNNFLPSTIGGDGYRIFKVYKSQESRAGAIVPVLAERIYGVFVLLILGFLGSLVSFLKFSDHLSLVGMAIGASGSVAILALHFLVSPGGNARILQKLRFIPEKLKESMKILERYHHEPALFYKFLGVTTVYCTFIFVYRMILIRAVGESCSFFSLMSAVMMSNILAILPISINGIGLLDGSFIYIISTFGVSYESAIMVMILHRGLSLLLSALGGVFYFMDKDSPGIEYYRKDRQDGINGWKI
jgi:uncharacterized protein (TIRG00374 family)